MRPVKTAFLCFALTLPAPFIRAQGQGVVDGRLVNGTNPANVPAKVQLDVIGLARGMSVIKSSVSDAAGKFRIDGLPADSPLLIRAEYKSVNYYGRATFDAAGKANVDIQVFEPTISSQGIRLDSLQMAFKLTGTSLSSRESYTLINETRPPQSFVPKDGSFRFSKAPGITELPSLDVIGPGSSMPVTQPPLESPDGQSYYSLYPLRPGQTAFEVSQVLPYQNGSYSYRKKFFQDVTGLQIDVIPQDMTVQGGGLTRVQTDTAQNFSVYAAGPIKAGTEVVWTFSGGTPVAESQPQPQSSPAPAAGEPQIRPMPTLIGQNAMIIGPLLLAGFLLMLWYASTHGAATAENAQDARLRELKGRREQLLNFIAALDARHEGQTIDRREYLRLREQGKRHLRRITMLLAKKQNNQKSEVRRKTG